MCAFLPPALYALGAWWLSTGIALWAVGYAARAPRAALCCAAFVFGGALAALSATAPSDGHAAAYCAFTAALLVWGVQEVAFLAGWITGPWRRAAPEGLGAWKRAGYAFAAILHHELALVASGIAVTAVTWGGVNQVGASTFAVLFVMRISAKLNVFLGVPNLTESFLPAHLAYLKSFFGHRPMNLLFPVSVTAITIALVLLVTAVAAADGAGVTALTLIATLVALALLEHWFLVLPLPAEALWAWSAPPAGGPPQPGPASPIEPDRGARVVRLDAYPSARLDPAPIGQLGRAERRIAQTRQATGSD